jgi:hypothetical protein
MIECCGIENNIANVSHKNNNTICKNLINDNIHESGFCTKNNDKEIQQ